MAKIDVMTPAGGSAGSVELDEAVFGIEPNVAVMHQVVTAQLAARRAGTHSTLTRREVRGGGAKPWKQKGTGRARAGSSSVPNWRGGGVAMGPKPRDYSQKTPKKMKRLALHSALSDRAAEGKVIVVDGWSFDTPRTKDAVAALSAIGAEGKVLLVVDRDDAGTWLSFRNLPSVHVVSPGELNTYDILVSDVVVFTKDNLPSAPAAAKSAKSGSRRSEGRATAAASTSVEARDGEEGSDDAAIAEESAEAADSSGSDAEASESVLQDPTADSDADGVANPEDETPFGPDSAHPLEDGSAPSDEYVIKGNADSMLYHPPESPFYGRTKAEVWFTTAEAAEAAGFSLPASMQQSADSGESDDEATSDEEEE